MKRILSKANQGEQGGGPFPARAGVQRGRACVGVGLGVGSEGTGEVVAAKSNKHHADPELSAASLNRRLNK